jgi:hypothetical protein
MPRYLGQSSSIAIFARSLVRARERDSERDGDRIVLAIFPSILDVSTASRGKSGDAARKTVVRYTSTLYGGNNAVARSISSHAFVRYLRLSVIVLLRQNGCSFPDVEKKGAADTRWRLSNGNRLSTDRLSSDRRVSLALLVRRKLIRLKDPLPSRTCRRTAPSSRPLLVLSLAITQRVRDNTTGKHFP